MVDRVLNPGRLRAAPENFLSEEQVKAVAAGRRDFLRKSFVAAGAALAAPMVARASEGDPNILENPTKASCCVASREVWPGLAAPRCHLRRCRACSASSRRPACTLSAIIRAGKMSIRPGTA